MRPGIDPIADLVAAGQLKRHTPFAREIEELLALAERQLSDAEVAELLQLTMEKNV